MKYARHGHALSVIGNRYVIITGSRKEIDNS
jgi:hypothetical protein